jgi:hypothetical protein
MMADNSAEYCSICHQPATSAWHGAGTIAICSSCAVDVLPALIADGVDLAHTRPADRLKLVALQVERNLWRGLALRATREK